MSAWSRRQLLGGAVAAGASFAAHRLSAFQGVPLGELQTPVDIDALREKEHAGDPVDLTRLRESRWTPERAHQYMRKFGPIKGIGYNATRFGALFQEWNDRMRSAVLGFGVRPRIEFPDAEFNEQVIAQELGWAQSVYGINSARIWMPTAMYSTDRERFYKFFETFLEIAASKGMTVMPVLGAGVRDPQAPAAQPDQDPNPEYDFLPGVWSTGFRRRGAARGQAAQSSWQERWPRMKPLIKDYIQTVVQRYAKDERILVWDLLNEPQTVQRPLVEYLFRWAREVNPVQPLSVCWNGHDLSDVITFHTYMRPGLSAPEGAPGRVDFLTELEWAKAWHRPMLCTEWLARPFGNRVENVLPFFSRHSVGWYAQSLVAGGPLQGQYPWNWPIGSPVPEEWFHCLLYPDGRPYRYDEVVMIRDFKYQKPPDFVNTQQYFSYGDSVADIRKVRPPLI